MFYCLLNMQLLYIVLSIVKDLFKYMGFINEFMWFWIHEEESSQDNYKKMFS